MSPYDILMLIIFVGAVLFGFWKGLAWQIASLAAIFLSYFVALNFRETVAQYISAEPPINKFAAMLILFLGTSLVVWIVFGRVSATIKKLQLKTFDRQAGALLGAFKGGLLCMVVTMFAVTLLGTTVRQQIINSRSGNYIATGIDQLTSVVPTELHNVIAPYVERYREALANEPQPTSATGQNSGGLFGSGQTIPASTSTTVPPTGNGVTYPGGYSGTPPSAPYATSPYVAPAGGQGTPVYRNPNNTYQPPTGQSGNYRDYSGTWQNSTAPPNYNQQQGYGSPAGYNQQPAGQGSGNYPGGGYSQPQSGTYPPQSGTYPPGGQGGYNQPGNTTAPAGQQPLFSQGDNGYPDINFKVNSRDLLESGGDLLRSGANQAIESILNSGGN